MAGGIDIHSHIAGGNVNTARLLLPEQHRAHARRPAATPLSNAGWSTFETGGLYAEMGFTTVVEPAVSPHQALHAHLELADIPIIDKAILAILGNDDFVLGLMRDGEGAGAIRDHVAWTLQTTRGARHQGHQRRRRRGVQGQRAQLLVRRRRAALRRVAAAQIVKALQRAVHELGVPHPLHVHCNNLGLPGNFETALDDHRRRRGPAAASRASAILRLRRGGQAGLLLRRAEARRGGQRGEERHRSTSAR